MFGFLHELKSEFGSARRSKLVLLGLLFVTVSMIVISAFSVPLWLGSRRVLPGGGLRVFFCYFCSIVFFFGCGAIVALLRARCARGERAKKATLDIIIAYALRLAWIIVFFGANTPVVTLLCLAASLVFLVFAVICTLRISALVTILEAALIVETTAMLVFNLKFLILN